MALAALASAVLATACSNNDNSGVNGGNNDADDTGSGSGSSAENDNVERILVTSDTDPNLINPWGIVGKNGVFWIADNGTGKVSVYDGTGRPSVENGLFTLVPGITGVVALDTETLADANEFLINTSTSCTPVLSPAKFIFASENGTLTAINDVSPATGVIVVDQSSADAVYKGVTEVGMPSGDVLLAANFIHGKLDMFDTQFRLVPNTTAFVDVDQPAGWGPFNVIRLGNFVYVTEAKIGQGIDEEAGAGLGAVAIFDMSGNRVGRITSPLFNAPWGVAVAATTQGTDTDDNDGDNDSDDQAAQAQIFVGNFGDGRISMFDANLASVGQLTANGKPFEQDGLWGLTFGSSEAGVPGVLYFVAGPQDETAGVFGRIEPPQ